MSPRDNWERLVSAVVRRQQLWELCHADSRTPSIRSAVSDEEVEDFPNEESPVEGYSEKGRLENTNTGGRVRGLIRLQWENFVRKKGKPKYVKRQNPRHGIVPKAAGGDQGAAGWPSWLAVVAGEARASSFEMLDKNLRAHGNLASASYEALPSFRDVPSSEKQLLFIWKAKICCVKFDFTDPTKNLREKQIKRQTLLELVEYMTSANGKFTANVVQEAVKMVALNIFREFTPQPREKMVSMNIFREFTPEPRENKLVDGIELKEDKPAMDPAWSHLQAVYEFFLRFVASSETDPQVVKRYIDHFFVLRFLCLFDSEDPREREYLRTILHQIYEKFFVYRPYIRRSINNIFFQFIFETEKHNGIAEILEVLGSIISGFTLPLREEHKLFLVRTLIPLHKPKSLGMYHEQLCYCIMQFVKKECKLAHIIIWGLIKYWPVTNSSKEVLFLNELEEVLEATQASEFQRCMVPLFHQVSHSLISLHFQVAERALYLWDNDYVENLIKQNRKVILPIIFPALEENARHHWNQSVRSLTLNIGKFFYDLDPDLFKACQLKFQHDKSKENDIKERSETKWKRLEELAQMKATNNEVGRNLGILHWAHLP